jgi:hypothetical protein
MVEAGVPPDGTAYCALIDANGPSGERERGREGERKRERERERARESRTV